MLTCLVVGTDESPRAEVSSRMRELGFSTKEACCVAEAILPLREDPDALVLLDWPMKRQGAEVVSILESPMYSRKVLVIENRRPVLGSHVTRQADDIGLESLKEVFAPLLGTPQEPKVPEEPKVSEAA